MFRDALLNPEGSIEVKWKYIKQNSKISSNLEIRGKIEVKKLSKKLFYKEDKRLRYVRLIYIAILLTRKSCDGFRT